MKKLLLALGCLVGAISLSAETKSIEMTFGSSNWESFNQYTETHESTDGLWQVVNFSNNNWASTWNNTLRCGRKSNASVATISTLKAIDKPISELFINIPTITADKVNSIKLYVSDTTDTTGATAYTLEKKTGEQTITITNPAENKYYTVEFDCAASANGFVHVSALKLNYDDNAPSLLNAGLVFSQESCEVNLGEDFTEPTLTKATDAEVNYESSNVAVATVDAATGKVTLIADGTTTITATTEATTTYAAGTASYTIKVTDPNKVVLEDELTTTSLEMSGSAYANYTDKKISTEVVYAVKASVNSNSIQINTANTGNAVNSCVINTSVPANLVIDKILVNANNTKFTISVSNSAWSFSGETTSTTITAPETSVDLTTPTAKTGDYYELIPGGNYQYFIIKSSGAVQMSSIKVIYRVVELPKAEEAEYIFEEAGIEADEQGNVDLKGGKATLHIAVPTGHSLYYKHTIHAVESAQQMRRVVDHGDFKKADVDEQGYAKIDVDKNSTLEYYTFHEGAQVKSAVTTLSFSGAGTTSISDINAAQTRKAIYDLQGRRISAPVRGINIIDGRKVRL